MVPDILSSSTSPERTLPAADGRSRNSVVMARNHNPSARSRPEKFGAIVCLLAILLGPCQVFPGLLAMEGSHTFRLGIDESQLHLVLSHERGQADRADYNPRHHPRHPAHCHGLAARVLCLFSGRGGVEPHHVANFATGFA